MIQWSFFRPRNFIVIALIVLLWMFMMSYAKQKLDQG